MAQGIGGRTVEELSRRMDYEEFLGWAAYFTLEPDVGTRVDVQTGFLMAQNYNMNRGKGKPARRPADFMPQWRERPQKEMSLDQLRMAMRKQFAALGGDPRVLPS